MFSRRTRAGMNVDLHVHTRERSPCGQSAERDQIRAAIAAGLDAVALTDHGCLPPDGWLDRINAACAPFRVMGGIEITVDGEDVLVLGVRDRAIESTAWTYPRLRAWVREQGGFCALAHPFRYHPDIAVPVREFPPDAIEVFSSNTPPDAAERIIALARELDLPLLSNSDAHAASTLGRHYNRLDARPRDGTALLAMLKRGQFTAVMEAPDGTRRTYRRNGNGPRA